MDESPGDLLIDWQPLPNQLVTPDFTNNVISTTIQNAFKNFWPERIKVGVWFPPSVLQFHEDKSSLLGR